MSAALYEGVVTTPRNPDQGGRRSVPGDCPRGVLSRPEVPEQRADLDTGSAPYRVGLEPAAGISSNAVAKDHFAAVPAGEQGDADDDRRRDQSVGQYAGPAIALTIACCQASPSVRMRPSPMMAFGNGSGASQIIQLLHVSSRAPGENRH